MWITLAGWMCSIWDLDHIIHPSQWIFSQSAARPPSLRFYHLVSEWGCAPGWRVLFTLVGSLEHGDKFTFFYRLCPKHFSNYEEFIWTVLVSMHMRIHWFICLSTLCIYNRVLLSRLMNSPILSIFISCICTLLLDSTRHFGFSNLLCLKSNSSFVEKKTTPSGWSMYFAICKDFKNFAADPYLFLNWRNSSLLDNVLCKVILNGSD